MFNAFNARSIFELGAKERVKIESILAYADKLLFGLNNGTLHVYHVISPDTPEISLSHIRTIERFSRRSVEALACIKEASILVSLSDGIVSVHDLDSFTLQQNLTRTKGATLFSVTTNIENDEETGFPSIVSRLAVGIKKRLLLYSWQDSEFKDGREVNLVGTIRNITWASSKKVVVGLGSGDFVIVDIKTGNFEEVVAPTGTNGTGNTAEERQSWGAYGMSYMGMGGRGAKPLSTRLKGEELLLVKDNSTLFIDQNGKAIRGKQPMKLTHAPDAITYSYPYLICLYQSKQHVEVRNPVRQTILQTISLTNVSILHVPPPSVALVHAGKLFYLASPTQVWRMGSVEYEEQVKQLIEMELLDEAISLLEQLESVLLDSKDEKIREVKMLKAENLFRKKQYRESMELFAEVEAPPERVIRLFPRIIAGDLSTVELEKPETETETRPSEDGEAVNAAQGDSGENPSKVFGSASEHAEDKGETPDAVETVDTVEGTSKASTNKPPNGHGIDAAHTIASLKKRADDVASIRSRKLADDASETASVKQAIPKKTSSIFDEQELKKAVNELTIYLGNCRLILSKYMEKLKVEQESPPTFASHSGGDGISPMKAPFSDSYFERNASVDSGLGLMEKTLQTAKLVHTTLFRAYMYAKPSLVGSLVRQPNHCDPDVVNERLKETGRYHDLVDFFGGKKLHREALKLLKQFGEAAQADPNAPTLHGPDRTVMYLQSLDASNLDLIFEFAEWPLRTDSDAGMEIFLTDSENAESLPRTKVLDYLQRIDRKLAIKYLEHLIDKLHDLTPEFHSRLVGLYHEHISKTSWSQEPDGEREKQKWKDKLLLFLQSSTQYRAENILARLPTSDPDFYEARAIVLSNLGKHKAALEIYVFSLQNHIKAEEYCVRIHSLSPPLDDPAAASAPSNTTVFHILLGLYLRPPPPHEHEIQLQPALGILSRHGARLEPSETLKLLPSTLPIASLESYFLSRIRHANSFVTENVIMGALRKVEMLKIQEELASLRGKCVVLEEGRVCKVCHKRLGRSIVSVRVDGSVVHYGCEKEREKASFTGIASGNKGSLTGSWRGRSSSGR